MVWLQELQEEEQEAGEIVEVTPEPTDEELLAQLGLQLEQQIADLTGSTLLVLSSAKPFADLAGDILLVLSNLQQLQTYQVMSC